MIPWEDVVRIDAPRVVAVVAAEQSAREILIVRELPGYHVSLAIPLAVMKTAVSVSSGLASRPFPAIVLAKDCDVLPEPLTVCAPWLLVSIGPD